MHIYLRIADRHWETSSSSFWLPCQATRAISGLKSRWGEPSLRANINIGSYILVLRPRGSPATMVGRMLMFVWSFGPLFWGVDGKGRKNTSVAECTSLWCYVGLILGVLCKVLPLVTWCITLKAAPLENGGSWRSLPPGGDRAREEHAAPSAARWSTVLLPTSWSHVGGCQTYGALLGPQNTRCRIIPRIQKGTIVLQSPIFLAGYLQLGLHATAYCCDSAPSSPQQLWGLVPEPSATV